MEFEQAAVKLVSAGAVEDLHLGARATSVFWLGAGAHDPVFGHRFDRHRGSRGGRACAAPGLDDIYSLDRYIAGLVAEAVADPSSPGGEPVHPRLEIEEIEWVEDAQDMSIVQ